eukprot:3896382-Rhodomonas_salina.2
MPRTKICSSPSQLEWLNLLDFAPMASLFFVFVFGCTLVAQCGAEEVGARAAPTGSSQQLSSQPSEASRFRQSISAHDNDQIKKWKQRAWNRREVSSDWSSYVPETCFHFDYLAYLSDPAGQIDYYFDGGEYGSNQECWWAVQVTGATAMSVSFSKFETEAGFDF